jgi:hypothetical protein
LLVHMVDCDSAFHPICFAIFNHQVFVKREAKLPVTNLINVMRSFGRCISFRPSNTILILSPIIRSLRCYPTKSGLRPSTQMRRIPLRPTFRFLKGDTKEVRLGGSISKVQTEKWLTKQTYSYPQELAIIQKKPNPLPELSVSYRSGSPKK